MPKLTKVHWKALERVILKKGFKLARERGSHRSYTKPGVKRAVVIPKYDAVPEFVIKNCLRTAGISREEYFEILED